MLCDIAINAEINQQYPRCLQFHVYLQLPTFIPYFLCDLIAKQTNRDNVFLDCRQGLVAVDVRVILDNFRLLEVILDFCLIFLSKIFCY